MHATIEKYEVLKYNMRNEIVKYW